MITDDYWDVAVELTLLLAQHQVVEAVRRLGHQDRHALTPIGVMRRPFHAEWLGELGEIGFELGT